LQLVVEPGLTNNTFDRGSLRVTLTGFKGCERKGRGKERE